MKYDAHINVEFCSSISAVKYIYKYIYKGHDRAEVSVEGQPDANQHGPVDEIKEYEDGRWFQAPEGCHRILGFDLHGRRPSVLRLQIHLAGEEHVRVEEDDDLTDIAQQLQAAGPPPTTLNRWFEYVKTVREDFNASVNAGVQVERLAALDVTYLDSPVVARWDASKKAWLERSNNKKFPQIGRIYHVSPSNQELFCLRTLLCRVKGAASFEELRTVDGELHPTFKAACIAMGMLEDDGEWTRCMEEAVSLMMPGQIRLLFANLMAYNNLQDPLAMWEQFKNPMSEDFLHIARQENGERGFDQFMYDDALREIDQVLRLMGSQQCLATYNLPIPAAAPLPDVVASEISKYDAINEAAKAQEVYQQANAEQEQAIDQVLQAVDSPTGKLFFLEGPGGTGKTYTYAGILHAVRGRGLLALPVASSGIAALLLEGGRTAHSRFKIPVPVLEDSPCYVSREEAIADVLRAAEVIVWDEAVMAHKWCFQAVDKTLRDLMGTVDPFKASQPC